jgi:hypothetical protein
LLAPLAVSVTELPRQTLGELAVIITEGQVFTSRLSIPMSLVPKSDVAEKLIMQLGELIAPRLIIFFVHEEEVL